MEAQEASRAWAHVEALRRVEALRSVEPLSVDWWMERLRERSLAASAPSPMRSRETMESSRCDTACRASASPTRRSACAFSPSSATLSRASCRFSPSSTSHLRRTRR